MEGLTNVSVQDQEKCLVLLIVQKISFLIMQDYGFTANGSVLF